MARENWTLEEAIEHEVLPELLEELEAAEKAMHGLRRPIMINFGLNGGPNPNFSKYERLNYRRKVASAVVWRHLLQKLKAGDLVATGFFGSTSIPVSTILPIAWEHIRSISLMRSTAKEGNVPIYGIRISRGAKYLPVSKPSKAEQNMADQRSDAEQCQEWLLKYILKNPKRRVATREKWWEVARSHWPELSKRAFNLVWTAANRAAGADAWPAAGHPRNTDVREVPVEARLL